LDSARKGAAKQGLEGAWAMVTEIRNCHHRSNNVVFDLWKSQIVEVLDSVSLSEHQNAWDNCQMGFGGHLQHHPYVEYCVLL
jgi:hypothetical protein